MNELNLVEVMNDEVVTTSLKVAGVFGETHESVIQDIENIISKLEEYDTELHCNKMFVKEKYKTSNGEEKLMYTMNRDGFTLLATFFTDDKAFEFKLKYIEQFKLMEKKLKEQHDSSTTPNQNEGSFADALVWIG